MKDINQNNYKLYIIMSKSVKSNFSDDSLDKIFDITKNITKSIDKNIFVKYVLIFLFIFALLSGLFAIYLNFTGQEDELE